MKNQSPTSAPFEPSINKWHIKQFIFTLTFAVCLVVLALFWFFHHKTSNLLEKQLLEEARAFFQQIVLTRQWIAKHSGVYVKAEPEEKANPYLANIPNIKTEIFDRDDQRYILKNPAIVTKEISVLGQEERIVAFHITSLNLLNQENKPDAFEKLALQNFITGNREAHTFEKKGKSIYFRYMAPLTVEKYCLQCHRVQGYKVGDIRGGISVSIPADTIKREIFAGKVFLVLFAALTLGAIIGIILYISRIFIHDLRKAQHSLYTMATRDFLTGLFNRREGLALLSSEVSKSVRKGAPLSAILLDIDHFKIINDDYGHQAGDKVLQFFAKVLKVSLRDYDFGCRYGGEEFLIALPGTTGKEAFAIAVRLRKKIASHKFSLHENLAIPITVSIGVGQYRVGESIDKFINRIDHALYHAKKKGRNTTVGANVST